MEVEVVFGEWWMGEKVGGCGRKEEGEIAADYLEELMDLADIDGDIDIDVADGRAQLSIVCEDDEESNLRTLVGKEGKTLGALQELSRLAVQTSTGQRSWLMLDIDGFRHSRRDELVKTAARAIDEVKESGEQGREERCRNER